MARGVQFMNKHDADGIVSKRRPSCSKQQPVLIRWAQKIPGIQSRRQANVFLVVCALVIFAVSAMLFWQGTPTSGAGGATYKEDIPPEAREELPSELVESMPSRSGQ